MKEGRMGLAKRRALKRFDDWCEMTGFFDGTRGYIYEMQSIIEDAVEIGAGMACGASYKEIKKRIGK